MTDIVERLRKSHGEYDAEAADEIIRLRIKVEAYDEQHEVARLAIEAGRILLEQRERLTVLLRGVGANRYWEGRWRDERRDNETLRAALNWISSRCPKEFMGQLGHPHRRHVEATVDAGNCARAATSPSVDRDKP